MAALHHASPDAGRGVPDNQMGKMRQPGVRDAVPMTVSPTRKRGMRVATSLARRAQCPFHGVTVFLILVNSSADPAIEPRLDWIPARVDNSLGRAAVRS